MIKIQKILVYIDFTDLSKKCLDWAIFFAKRFNRELHLLHVINNNTYNYFSKNDTENTVLNELKKISAELENVFNIKSNYSTKEGCTCTVINSTAEQLDAFMVLLATHGKNDLQFLSGHEVVKIIRKSRFPYFVIQKSSPTPSDNKNIVLPIDVKKENKEKTGWVSYFGKNIPAKVKMLYENIDDSRLKNNILFCTKFFNELNIKYSKLEIKKTWSSINKKALDYANKNNALTIIITTTKDESIFHKIFGFPETNIISNSYGMPVLCINPKKDLYIPCI